MSGQISKRDKPREACGVFAIYGNEEAGRVTFFGLFALQHRGQESAGIATADGHQMWKHKGMGLASEVFREDILSRLPGHLAIGHVRYSTTGSSVLSNAQPFLVHHADEYYALAHNGNLINAQSLRTELEDHGSIFQSTMDSEVVIHLMAPYLKCGIEEALTRALSRVEGAYSIVMLTRDKVIAARDPRGFRPLCLGSLNGGWVVASETCALRWMVWSRPRGWTMQVSAWPAMMASIPFLHQKTSENSVLKRTRHKEPVVCRMSGLQGSEVEKEYLIADNWQPIT
ncbi:MAG: class II glutamine amidotransferase [Syntrophales bacterium]|nr:class II glutamine amidotransferase [Syntrophales bacterium]